MAAGRLADVDGRDTSCRRYSLSNEAFISNEVAAWGDDDVAVNQCRVDSHSRCEVLNRAFTFDNRARNESKVAAEEDRKER